MEFEPYNTSKNSPQPDTAAVSEELSSETLRLAKMNAEKDVALTHVYLECIRKRIDIHAFAYEYFTNADFFFALPETIQKDTNLLMSYLEHSSKFFDLIERKGENPLFWEKITLPESVGKNGHLRTEETGKKIELESLIQAKIDPTRVLFFRRTLPSNTPKPELYWTNDFFETKSGLTQEISGVDRENSIVLIADLQTISEHGLMRDMNDCQGLSVRQLKVEPFDQSACLARIEKK